MTDLSIAENLIAGEGEVENKFMWHCDKLIALEQDLRNLAFLWAIYWIFLF